MFFLARTSYQQVHPVSSPIWSNLHERPKLKCEQCPNWSQPWLPLWLILGQMTGETRFNERSKSHGRCNNVASCLLRLWCSPSYLVASGTFQELVDEEKQGQLSTVRLLLFGFVMWFRLCGSMYLPVVYEINSIHCFTPNRRTRVQCPKHSFVQ